jgi:hypothetical protein
VALKPYNFSSLKLGHDAPSVNRSTIPVQRPFQRIRQRPGNGVVEVFTIETMAAELFAKLLVDGAE